MKCLKFARAYLQNSDWKNVVGIIGGCGIIGGSWLFGQMRWTA